jgi:hypothetical protein
MAYFDPKDIPVVRKIATFCSVAETHARSAGLPRGTVRGVVKDVDDPQNRGRVRVLFDCVNLNVPQVQDGPPREGNGDLLSHWIDVCPAFEGKQPRGLLGKRVSVVLSNGQYQYAILQDVLHDKENLTEEAASRLEMPNNSSMTRLPGYYADEMPKPCEANHGCCVIEKDGPMDSDWLSVCMKRDGGYFWVRHVDLSHGHAGGNDGTQANDSLGSRQNPVMMGTVGDGAFPTTAQQFKQNSEYTTRPQGNPKGEDAHWYPAVGSGQEYEPGEDFDLLNPDPDISLAFVRDAAGFPSLDFSIAGFAANLDVAIPTVLQPDAIASLQKAQSLLATAQGIVSDPLGFVTNTAFSAAKGLVGDSVGGLINQATTAVGGVAGQAVANALGQAATGAATQAVGSLATQAVNSIARQGVAAIGNLAGQAVGGVAGQATEALGDAATQAVGNVIGQATEAGITEFTRYIPPGTFGALGNLQNIYGTLNTAASSTLAKVFSGPLTGLQALASSAIGAATSQVQSLVSSILA